MTSLISVRKLGPQSSTTSWVTEVMAVLRPFHLELIIDSTTPKPDAQNPNFQRWKYWTGIVAEWLLKQVDDSLQRVVKVQTPHLTYADEVFKTIKMMNAANHRSYVERELARWQNMRRVHFRTPADFIMAYQNQFNRLKIEGEEDPCGMALKRLLNELGGEHIRIHFIREEVNDRDRPVDYQLFSYYCRLLISEFRENRDLDLGLGGGDDGSGNGGRGSGGGRGSRGSRSSHSGSFSGGEVSYKNWRKENRDAKQPR
jgi:transposase